MKFIWKIGGEAGFGIATTGLVFSKIASRLGYHIFDYIEYPSLIRGGHNSYEVVVSDEEALALESSVDYLVCLNKDTFTLHKDRLNKETYIIYDEEEFEVEGDYKKINVPLNKIIKNNQGQTVMKNTVALGASLALIGGDVNVLNDIIKEQFEKKGEAVVSFNQKFAGEGFNYIKENFASAVKPLLTDKRSNKQLVITGNDAFSLGSVIADCRLYAAYPMTPASSVLTTLAAWQKTTGMVVRHAEDEIAVINTAIGASFAGVRAAVGTSGGGFALMVETVSLAGITETPLVIFISQRPGPATGMPTWTEQGDLLFTVHSGHGEFPKIVLAPGDQEEMIELTAKAFNLADIYQTPVFVMSDMYLSESHKTVNLDFINELISSYRINRGKILNLKTQNSKPNLKTQNFPRYKITEDGISERLVPGTPGYYYQSNSYEHLEDGHTTESPLERNRQVEKRSKKTKSYLKQNFQLPRIYGDIDKAETVFVSWGSTKGLILEAINMLTTKGKTTALIHFNHIYPLDEVKISKLFISKKRYILVENNSTGQFGRLLRQETGINITEKILKYDGRPITSEEIVKHVNTLTR